MYRTRVFDVKHSLIRHVTDTHSDISNAFFCPLAIGSVVSSSDEQIETFVSASCHVALLAPQPMHECILLRARPKLTFSVIGDCFI